MTLSQKGERTHSFQDVRLPVPLSSQQQGKITLIISKKKNSYSRPPGGPSKNTSKQPSPFTGPMAAPQRRAFLNTPESPELSTPASNKPRTSPDHESSHAILTTSNIRSGHWHLPWELSRPETGWFQPLTSPNPPETTPDGNHSRGKKVWAIPSPRRERGERYLLGRRGYQLQEQPAQL